MWKFIVLSLLSFTALAQNGNSCPDGMSFNIQANRCMMSQDTVEQKTDAANCEGLSGDAYKKCFEDNVAKGVGKLEADGKIEKQKDPKANFIVPAIVTLGGAYLIFMSKSDIQQCGSISAYLMLGGGIATLLGEFMAQRGYKGKLKKLQKKYEERLADKDLKEGASVENMNQNQIIAFDYQIEQERAREKAHKSRKTTYTLAFAAYTAATAAAIFEQFTIAGAKGCNLSNKGPGAEETTTSSSTTTASAPAAGAEAPAAGTPAGDGVQTVATEAGGKVYGIISRGFRTPFVRAALSGVLALYSKKIASKAGKLAKEAGKRADEIEKLKENFLATGGAGFNYCSDADRRTPSNGRCYCYLPSGQKNMARDNSPACLRIWNMNKNVTPDAMSSSLATTDEPVKGCLNSDASFNANCDCKVKKCTTFNGSLNLGQLASVNGTKSMMDATEGLSTGRLSSADISSAGLERMAASIDKQKDKWAKAPQTASAMKKIKDLELGMNKDFGAAIESALKTSAPLANFAKNNSGFGSANIEDGNQDKKLANIIGRPGENKNLPSVNPSRSNQKGGLEFDFDSPSANGGVTIEDAKADVMSRNFKINDINDNDEGNLFTIIHNRYQSSGMRRLFSGELETN